MAYEDITYEAILDRMIERVSEKYPNLDTREGSIIFNALAPAAIELAMMYAELDNVLAESFVDTASREYLLMKCKEVGINIEDFDESYGVHRGIFDVEVPIGSRWNCDLYNFEVTEFIGMDGEHYSYKMECDTPGTVPNNQTGNLTPITEYPMGLGYAYLIECLIEGEEETSDDEVRNIYYAYVNSGAIDGNIGQYETWCELYDGIGHYKIFPLWNGENTVKVSILSSSNRVASTQLIEVFQNYLDPNSEGMGNGVAPIGAKVTVTTGTEKPINVKASVKLKSGYTDTSPISTAIDEYLRSIAYEKLTVSYLNIGACILNVECVESVSNLVVNNGTNDIHLGTEEVPVVGTAEWTVV
jgi:uncharacterized phage protein gp47/JayE